MKYSTARIDARAFAFADEDSWARAYTDEHGVRRCAETGARFVGCRCAACRTRKDEHRRYVDALSPPPAPRGKRHLRLV